MTQRVSVISTTNTKGEIAPLWVKLTIDEEDHTYKVLRAFLAATEPLWGNYLTYICAIMTEDKIEKEIKLRYHIRDHYWEMTFNNSAKL